MIQGIPASGGIGIGTAVLLRPQSLTYESKPAADKKLEKQRLHAAIAQFVQDTQKVADTFGKRLDARDAEILTGHIDMIQDPFLQEEMDNRIDEGLCAEGAAEAVLEMFKALFLSSEVELIQQRATDVEDIRQKLLEILLGVEQLDLKHLPKDSILVVDDLTPSMTAEMDHDSVAGIVTQRGGMTSHSAILSRALGIPAVLSVPDALERIQDGTKVIVDGTMGVVQAAPTAELLAQYRARQNGAAAEKRLLEQFRGLPTQTKDGKTLQVLGNIGTPAEAVQVAEEDGEGVGLFRTEFLYMNRTEAPDEETQYQAYQRVCDVLKGKPVIIRTLDVGGDKDIPYLHLEQEENPFLGYRAVRYCLGNQDAFRTQLTALMRAGADSGGQLWIMIPMVTTVAEIKQVRQLAEGISQKTGLPLPKIGTMIETPSAMLMADVLAKYCDFFSIGTNDLIHYLMAIDRNNLHVGYLNEALHPAVVRSLKRIIDSAHREGIGVSVCGELAADPYGLALLLGMGVDTLSASPRFVPGMKHMIRRLDAQTCMDMAHSVLMSTDVTASQRMLRERLQESLGSELAFHTTSIMTNS